MCYWVAGSFSIHIHVHTVYDSKVKKEKYIYSRALFHHIPQVFDRNVSEWQLVFLKRRRVRRKYLLLAV